MSMLSPLKFVKRLLAVLSTGLLSCRKNLQGQPASHLVFWCAGLSAKHRALHWRFQTLHSVVILDGLVDVYRFGSSYGEILERATELTAPKAASSIFLRNHSFIHSFVHSFRFILLFLLDQSDLIRIAARFDMDTERDAFVSSLAKFTYLTTIKAQVVTADIELSHVEKRCPEPYEALGSKPLCHYARKWSRRTLSASRLHWILSMENATWVT